MILTGPYPYKWAVAGGKSLEAIHALWLTDGRQMVRDNPERIHENLRIIGMAGPGAIRVVLNPQTGHPEAEMIRNAIYPHPVDQGTFFIRIPIDYKGCAAIPDGAKEIADPVDHKVINSLIFVGGWGDSEPLQGIFSQRMKTSLPDDYTPPSPPPAPPSP